MFWIVLIIGIIATLMGVIVSQRNEGGSIKSKAIKGFLGIIATLALAIVANWLYDYMASGPSNETGNDNNSNIADINNDGKITTVDAKWVLQAVSGIRALTEEQKAAADVNSDGKITTVDAKWILQAVSGSRALG